MLPDGMVLPAPFKRAAGAARAALRRALDIALPPLCAACREPVAGRGLCAACWSKLSFITRPYCERLGTPFVYDPGPGILSMEAIADPPAYHRARAAVRFDEIARALVHSLKYGDRLDLAPIDGTLALPGGLRASRRGRCVDPSAPALAPFVGAALQSVGNAGGRRIEPNRRPGHYRRPQTYKADAATGRPVADRTRRQCSRRISRAG
jgi:Double zinc ribbon domain